MCDAVHHWEWKADVRFPSPITEAYNSALKFASPWEGLSHVVVTRAEYQESGSNASWRKFRDWRTAAGGSFDDWMTKSKNIEEEPHRAMGTGNSSNGTRSSRMRSMGEPVSKKRR